MLARIHPSRDETAASMLNWGPRTLGGARGGFIMHRYLVAAAALVGACGMAHADVPELGGTVWVIIEGPATDLCTIDEIDFAPDGTATVYFVVEDDGEAATWTQDGASLKLA